MKHLMEYKNLNEAIAPKNRTRGLSIQQIRLKTKFNPFNLENDKFLRMVYCKDDAPKELTKGKLYRLYAEFETGAMLSGKCFVVLTDDNHFIGLDSGYFIEEYEVDAKKYNL